MVFFDSWYLSLRIEELRIGDGGDDRLDWKMERVFILMDELIVGMDEDEDDNDTI